MHKIKTREKIASVSKSDKILKILLASSALILTVICIFLANYYGKSYADLEVGSLAPKRFTAPIQTVNRVATDKRIEEAAATISTLYTHDEALTKIAIDQLAVIIDFLEENRVKELFNSSITTGSVQGHFNEFVGIDDSSSKTTSAIPFLLSKDQHSVYNLLTEEERTYFCSVAESTLTLAMEKGVTSGKEDLTYRYVQEELDKVDLKESARLLCYDIVVASILPNVVVDTVATEMAKQVKVSEVSPVIVLRGQKIIDEGEIITEEIYEILKSLNLIAPENSSTVLNISGITIVIVILLAFLFAYIYTFDRILFTNKKDMLLMFTLYVLSLAVMAAMSSLPFTAVPLVIFVMLYSVLIDTRLSIIFNLTLSIVGFFVFEQNVNFLIYSLVSGTAAAMLTKLTYSRNKVLFVGGAISVTNAVTVLALGLLFEHGVSEEQVIFIGLSALSGFLSVIITTGSLPLWEAIFDVITPIKLMDLINPDNKLLRRLALETPGTYHHSLVVANLAESAALDIEANSILARVGSYYHDIGKLKTPLYFSENQAGKNPHDKLTAIASTKIILTHVTHGTELALKNNLPLAIRDILVQHHGTTLVKYFYYKAKKECPDKNIKESDYRYTGPTPQSKEAAIVMLADTVEAATRSVMADGKKFDELDTFIKNLIKDKLDDGQLNESKLSIKDLDTIRLSFLKVFSGMYHDRIAYPTDEKPAVENLETHEKIKHKELAGEIVEG